jgi:hypothetical protein
LQSALDAYDKYLNEEPESFTGWTTKELFIFARNNTKKLPMLLNYQLLLKMIFQVRGLTADFATQNSVK